MAFTNKSFKVALSLNYDIMTMMLHNKYPSPAVYVSKRWKPVFFITYGQLKTASLLMEQLQMFVNPLKSQQKTWQCVHSLMPVTL